jgi:hypothetical protein
MIVRFRTVKSNLPTPAYGRSSDVAQHLISLHVALEPIIKRRNPTEPSQPLSSIRNVLSIRRSPCPLNEDYFGFAGWYYRSKHFPLHQIAS